MGKQSMLYGENLFLTLGNFLFVAMSVVTVVINNVLILLIGSFIIIGIMLGIYYGIRLHLYQTIGGLMFLNARIVFPDLHIQEEIIGINEYIELDIDNDVNIDKWEDWDVFKNQMLSEMKNMQMDESDTNEQS